MKSPRVLSLLVASVCLMQAKAQQPLDVWLGTGGGLAKGIYHTQFNPKNGRLTPSRLVAEIARPGFLAMHPNRSVLYSVGNLKGVNAITAYQIEGSGKNAKLKLLNSVDIGDGGAAHLCVDQTARTLVSAQYGGGSVAVFALNKDGSIKGRTQLIEHEGGSKVNERRQKSPHPHWTGISPDNRFVFIPDLGLDQVVIYKLDAANSKLTPNGHASANPGSGPRHMKFHTSGKWVYLLNELDLTVTVYDYDAKAGKMTAKQTIETVPPKEWEKEKARSCSEIRVHPNGKFVYAANRGHDTITAFRVDQKTGKLKFIERENVRGATPRNFNLDPSGKWLLAGGQASHTLSVFSVNEESGELTYNQHVSHTPRRSACSFNPNDLNR